MTVGCLILKYGRFDLYKVNPPLVKTLAAVPVVAAGARFDWSDYVSSEGVRNEWDVGEDMMVANGRRSFALFSMARCSLLVLWLIGTWIVWQWSAELWGRTAGMGAVLLWCTTPEIMAWTATICPDSAAASMGILAVWLFRRWILEQHWTSAVLAGTGLGLAILTKTSWLVLIPVLPLLTIMVGNGQSFRTYRQLTLIGLVALLAINCGYGFERSCTRLGDFRFFSKSLAGEKADGTVRKRLPSDAGNRFSAHGVGEIPIPVPASFVEGLDLQKYDFEEGKWSYLRGEHRFGGWWYWYTYALLVKTPVGTLLILAFTCMLSSIAAVRSCRAGLTAARSRESFLLLVPALSLFVLVSSQTGFTRYLRYVLPSYPFVIIWMSQVFRQAHNLRPWLRRTCAGLLVWSVVSSWSVYPHSMSYFNELAGGPDNGPNHLIDASIDWGQDVLFLADWLSSHPEARRQPLKLSLHTFFDPRIAGIDYEHPPYDPRFATAWEYPTSGQAGPLPGWYAVSVHHLHSRTREFAYLLDFPRTAMAGYSICLYHLTDQQVADWCRKRALNNAAN